MDRVSFLKHKLALEEWKGFDSEERGVCLESTAGVRMGGVRDPGVIGRP